MTETLKSQQVKALAKNFEDIQQGLHSLAIVAAQATRDAVSLARVLEVDEAHQAKAVANAEALRGPLGAFVGITKGSPQPVPMPSYPVTPPQTRLNVANERAQKAANLTDEARKLINTGASYDRAIAILMAKYPLREREHIRRAVGRANGGRS